VSDDRAGQEGPTPDFIPGWFAPRQGNPDPVTREAVRIPEVGDHFPITFLRSSESVHNPRRPQLGFCIGNSRHSEMELAVPPGYWIVRDSDGDLANWRDEDFKAKYTRSDRDWTPPVDRDVPSGRPAAAERNLHGAISEVDAITPRGPLRDNPHLPPGYAEKLTRELAEGEGWRGTPPAHGTRRRLILDTIERYKTDHGNHPASSQLADAVESALLQSTIADEDSAEAQRTMFEAYVAKTQEALRDDRSDEWVQQVVMRAIVAGQECDVPFPADVVDAVLREFDCRPTLPRQWPPIHGRLEDGVEADLFHEDKADDEDAPDDRQLLRTQSKRLKEIESRCDRLLEQREEARGGEDHWKAQRDAALNLLRWLIGDLIENRSDV